MEKKTRTHRPATRCDINRRIVVYKRRKERRKNRFSRDCTDIKFKQQQQEITLTIIKIRKISFSPGKTGIYVIRRAHSLAQMCLYPIYIRLRIHTHALCNIWR